MSEAALYRELGDGLVLQSARNAEDLERIAELHGLAFEPAVTTFTRVLFCRYPGMQAQNFVYVQDTATGEVVSSICLVPTTWHYEGVPLRVAELGIVGTHPDYRRRGLVRAQMRWFESQLQAQAFDLASIQGIRFFYRQFGYEYILPLGPSFELAPNLIPDPLEAEETATVRRASAEDLPRLLEFLAMARSRLSISVERDPAMWCCQDAPDRDDEDVLDTYLVLEAGKEIGYFRLLRRETPAHPGVQFVEASPLSHRGCLAALRLAKQLAATRRHERTIRFGLPVSTPLVRLSGYLGGRPVQPYAWQVRIPDPVRFLRRIGPVLERRLAQSFLAGYSNFMRIDLYTDTIELTFREGRLADVRSLGPLESCSMRFPWWAAWQLWLGYRGQAELTAWYPDACVCAALQPLVDVLFPKRESWVFPTL